MTEALTLYVQDVDGALSEMRTYIRDHGLTRPKLGRMSLPISGVRYPILTFTFPDIGSATMFRMRFNVKVFNEDTLNQIEDARRDRIGHGVQKMGLAPELAKAVATALIEQTPLNLSRIR